MQETLNRMVASVRHGYIVPEEASRTVHECAAMLGLQLAENIPENALIVTGMRKTVLTHEMEASFKEFGEIEAVAVSPNKRGFGKCLSFYFRMNMINVIVVLSHHIQLPGSINVHQVLCAFDLRSQFFVQLISSR